MPKPFTDHRLTVDEYSDWNARELARHPVSRRLMLKAVAAGAGGYALAQFTLATSAFAAGGGTAGPQGVVVSGRHLSFMAMSRYGHLPSNSMAVTAQLVSKTGSLPTGLRAYVDIGTGKNQYGRRIEAEIQHLVGQYAIPGGPIGSQFYAKAELTGLQPATLYHYRYRLSDGTVTGDAFFTTAPAREKWHGRSQVLAPFTFTAFADVGTNTFPTDPKYAWNEDPALVKAAGGAWPNGKFDNNYYNPADPVAGLNGTDPTPAVTLTHLMSTQKPRFTLLAGDICYADPSGTGLPADDTGALTTGAPPGKNLYNPYVWDVFLAQIESQAAFTPWMFATGNHDMEPLYGKTESLGGSSNHGYGGHLKRLDLPGTGPKGCPSVYSFIYGNVAVISLDVNDLSAEIQTNTGYSGGAQVEWLESTLEEWRTNPHVAPTIDFVVVFFHHCAYSTTNTHASDGGVRDVVDPLFSKYQVDLVVQGHNHLMERTDPIKYGKATRKAPDGTTIRPAQDGVTYLTVGSGGRPRYPFRVAPSADAPPPPGVKPFGPQLLPEGQRYRGYTPPGGANKIENNTENVVNSYVWSKEGTAVTTNGFPSGTKVPEQIEWSQVRYDDYAFIAVDVVPARPGCKTTFTIRTIADALPGSGKPYSEIDRITLERVAGHNAIHGRRHTGLLLPSGQPATVASGS